MYTLVPYGETAYRTYLTVVMKTGSSEGLVSPALLDENSAPGQARARLHEYRSRKDPQAKSNLEMPQESLRVEVVHAAKSIHFGCVRNGNKHVERFDKYSRDLPSARQAAYPRDPC